MLNQKKQYLVLILAAALLLVGSVVCGDSSGPTVKNSVSIEQRLKQGARVFDVRTPAEFAGGAFPGAVNIPVGEVEARIAEFGPKEGSIIVYCASGGRSSRAASILKRAGYMNVVNAGGLKDMPGR